MIGCAWIISERGDRWRRAVDSFAPTILPTRFQRIPAGPSEVYEAVRRHSILPQLRQEVRPGVRAPLTSAPFPEGPRRIHAEEDGAKGFRSEGFRSEGFCAGTGAAEAGGETPAGAWAVVVLYELPLERPRETLAAVARCAALEHSPLQLVALAAELRIEERAELELTAALRQLGAGAVLRHPEHLWQVGRSIARHLHRWEQLAARRL